MINNNGLFMLLSLSTKPLAKQFMKQYINEIMPLWFLPAGKNDNNKNW